LWFYSAAFHEMTDRLLHRAVVYDCMDELTAFKGAPEQLAAQEKKLLSKADLVFTGGKSLYEAKIKLHQNVRCYPSSVDREHFEKATHGGTAIPADIQHIAAPIAGYIGVIDERIDLALLHTVADSNPLVSFVMIGPVVKIDERDLPKLPNVHYLGMKSYGELPGYLKAFAVATMPFALNESTRFISPTKTLEYIAAMKPVVSTPVRDVVRDYSNTVAIADSAKMFSNALQRFVNESPLEATRRRHRYDRVLNERSWDATVGAMQEDILRVLAGTSVAPLAETTLSTNPAVAL
jgi:glycosyltransferase involved in cell wall biosynthesis